jgi:hypothetical protein
MMLLTLGNIGVSLILPVSMGGNDLNLHFAITFLIIATSSAMYLAWYNIKCHQIDEHRKWMLRAMFWMGTIVTMRIVMAIMVFAVTYRGGYATVRLQATHWNIKSKFLTSSFGRATKSNLW